jgi:eukaryotic-like serine/threonine-protein kinase
VEATTSQVSLASLQTALAGRYSFERELGRGGMATVFLARDLTHDRHVAVKVLLPELAVTLGMERFLREIDVGTTLQHPRIVGVLDSGSSDGILYYTMPYIDGQTLRDRLNREKQLPVEDTIEIAQQVADALTYAHSKGIIHRDIKPENILLDKTGALVADFGIARAVSVAGGENLTRTGMAIGTPTYMSPEQAMGSRDVTPESDIYSLACVVYELLAGQPPFTGPTAMALLARHSLDNVPSLKIVRGTVPDAVEDAIVRAMAKVPADRFHLATDFANALTDTVGAARRRQDSLKAKAIAAETVERPALGGSSKKKGLMIGAAAAVLALGGAGAWFAMSGGGSSSSQSEAEAARKRSIAVMYIEDRSPGNQMGYLADGITEALINELSAVPQLKVISRNGVAPFKGKPASDSIAKALNIGTFVTGVLTPAPGGNLKVELQLVDASTNKNLATTKVPAYPPDKLLELQDSLARDISFALRQHLGDEITAITLKAGTRNNAAWDAMQRANQIISDADALIRARQVPGALQKIDEADAALAKVEPIDKSWTQPIVDRAWLSFRKARLLGSSDANFAKVLEAGLAHADRALKAAPADTAAIEVRGTLHYWQWLNNVVPPENAAAVLKSAEADLTAATALGNGGTATAWNALSHLRINKGELTLAKLAAENSVKADPYLADVDRTIYRLFGAALDLGEPKEADRWCAEGNRRFPQNFLFTECKLLLLGMRGGAKPMPDSIWALRDSVVAAAPPNRKAFFELKSKILAALALVQAGLPDSAKRVAEANQGDSEVDPLKDLANLAAIVFAQAGDTDKALEYLAKYLSANPQARAFQAKNNSEWFKPIRNDPRYTALVGKTN